MNVNDHEYNFNNCAVHDHLMLSESKLDYVELCGIVRFTLIKTNQLTIFIIKSQPNIQTRPKPETNPTIFIKKLNPIFKPDPNPVVIKSPPTRTFVSPLKRSLRALSPSLASLSRAISSFPLSSDLSLPFYERSLQ